MLKRVGKEFTAEGALVRIGDARYPVSLATGLEYSSPARGTWNIVHTGMLIPQAHEIYICAAGCLRGVILTAVEMGLGERFSTVEIREHNLLDGDMEDLVIDGVSDILRKLPEKPPAVLVYTCCLHHFAGCDLSLIYRVLRARFPDIDFADCYMNPIMRKSGLTPDQLMRSRLYSLLKPREINPKAVAIIGNDLPTDPDSELVRLLVQNGFILHEITACRTYEEYQEMAESAFYISYYPSARAGGDELAERLRGRHISLSNSFLPDEIEAELGKLADALQVPRPDYSGERAGCEREIRETLSLVGGTPIAADYTFTPRILSLVRLLVDNGFNLKRVYADSFSAEEKADFEYLQAKDPDLMLCGVTNVKMRFMAGKEPADILAIGQKAAYFENTGHFVNVVEGGGMFGFEGIRRTMRLIREAYREEKDTRALIQIKGWGCEICR